MRIEKLIQCPQMPDTPGVLKDILLSYIDRYNMTINGQFAISKDIGHKDFDVCNIIQMT